MATKKKTSKPASKEEKVMKEYKEGTLHSGKGDEEKVKYGRGIEENPDYWIYWRWREEEERETGLVDLLMEKARHTKTQKIKAVFRPDLMQIRTLNNTEVAAKNSNSNDLAVGPHSDFWGGIEGRSRF